MPRQSFWKKDRKITNRTVLLFLVAVFILGGIASGVFINHVFPYLADIPGFRALAPRFTVIVNKTEEVRISEGVKMHEIYERIRAATVTIISQGSSGPLSLSGSSAGTSAGMLVTSDGLIFTTQAAVGNFTHSLFVVLDDGRSFPGEVLAFDPKSELAVVKIAARDLPVVNFGFSSELSVGDKLVAVGSGLSQFEKPALLVDFVQKPTAVDEFPKLLFTDRVGEFLETTPVSADLGDGLIFANRDAAVVGLASGEGILTGEYLRSSLDDFLADNELLRPRLGINYLRITPALSELLKLPKAYGVLVRSGQGLPAVFFGSPAQKAGLREGDFIYKINDTEITADRSFERLLYGFEPGEKIEVVYYRGDEEKAVEVTLVELK